MIVLDTPTKSLKISGSGAGLTTLVTYWSIDSSNVWTPHSFGTTGGVAVDILPAPGAGEVSRVVENIWIHINSVINFNAFLLIFLDDTAGDSSNIARFISTPTAAIAAGTTFTMSRDGSFIRQMPLFVVGAPTAVTQNVN